MDRKKQKPLIYDPRAPLHKADDWSRRAFMTRAAMFLTAFGVPWTWRMETLEKLSKKILGSSTAFAQSQGNTLLLVIGWRSGWPADNIIGDLQDSVGADDPARNFHATSSETVVIPASGSMKQNLYLPPQMADALAGVVPVGAPFAERMAKLTACKNVTGHINGSSSLWMNGGAKGSDASTFVSHAAKMSGLRPTLLQNHLVYGASSNFDYGPLGSAAAAFAPTYVSTTADVQGLFKPTQLKASDGSVLSDTLSKEIAAVQDQVDEQFLTAIETREGVATLRAGKVALAALLETNLSDLLDPQNDTTTAGFITALTTGVTEPNSRFNTGNESIAEQVAIGLRCMQLGICNGFGHTIRSGDWHNSQAGSDGTNNQGVTANDRGDGTVQAEHAQWFGEFFTRLLNLADSTAFDGSTEMMGPKLRIVNTSEFARTINGGPATGDNGDGGHVANILIGDGLNGGSYGDHTAGLKSVQPDLVTGDATVEGQLPQENSVHTIRRFVGLDDASEHDEASVVKAIVP